MVKERKPSQNPTETSTVNSIEVIRQRIQEMLNGRPDIGLFPPTQEQLAEAAGISQGYLSQILKGEVKNPSIDVVNGLAHISDMTVSQFIGEEEKESGTSFNYLAFQVNSFLNNPNIPHSDKKLLIKQVYNLLDYFEIYSK